MTAQETLAWLTEALADWATHAPELRDLDAAVGDGDLGVTVARGVDAVRAALAELKLDTAPADVCRASGAAFAKGSPSTLSALIGGGLLAAAKALKPQAGYDYITALTVLRTATSSIAQRGRCTAGDKTILDALEPSLATMESSPAKPGRDLLNAMATAAETAVAETAGTTARRGRAAWLRERSAGHRDPGATAYALLLRSLEHAWPGPGPASGQGAC